MKIKFILCGFFLPLTFAITTFGQNAEQIKEKYGQPVKAYSVSEQIWMTPEFTDDGQVCAMQLYPKRLSETTNYLSDKLNYWELNKVLNQLVPAETRGKPTLLFGLTRLGGGVSQTTYNYEKVGFVFLVSFSMYLDPIDKDKPKNKEVKPAKFTQGKSKGANPDEEMIVPREVEIVTITWNERRCAKK